MQQIKMEPCAVCVLHAIQEGVDFAPPVDPNLVVGTTYGELPNMKTIHPKVTTLAGTDVCWYHVTLVSQEFFK